MIHYRCFLCSVRIGRKHVMLTNYMDACRHVVRLCYGCGMPDFEATDPMRRMRRVIESNAAVEAKLREIKTLEV